MKKASIEERVNTLWASEDKGHVQAVVGPYKLYDTSFRTLEGTNWLSDEVIDAYYKVLVMKEKNTPVHHINAVVASALFVHGRFETLRKMKFPTEDTWLCPLNVGAHWILLVIHITQRQLVLIDPLSNEGTYQRKVLRNWRNFLRRVEKMENEKWSIATLEHKRQQDSCSCGVLILMFAEAYLLNRVLSHIETSPNEMEKARFAVACTLLQNSDK
ncbi:unnamed protein product [Knipowitschia caucasica]